MNWLLMMLLVPGLGKTKWQSGLKFSSLKTEILLQNLIVLMTFLTNVE